jgi:hypothetical protein
MLNDLGPVETLAEEFSELNARKFSTAPPIEWRAAAH